MPFCHLSEIFLLASTGVSYKVVLALIPSDIYPSASGSPLYLNGMCTNSLVGPGGPRGSVEHRVQTIQKGSLWLVQVSRAVSFNVTMSKVSGRSSLSVRLDTPSATRE